MGRPINVAEKLEQAKVAEEAGLLATALNLHRVCYLAARPNSAERRVRMADMLRLRKAGASGSIPGDRSGDHPAHMKLRRDLSLTDAVMYLRGYIAAGGNAHDVFPDWKE